MWKAISFSKNKEQAVQNKIMIHGALRNGAALIGALLFVHVLPMVRAADAAGVLSGTVVETMNSGGYTYLLVDDGKAKQWVATTAVELKAGSKVEVPVGMQMTNFFSPKLKRLFADIRFIDNITVDGKKQGAAPSGHGQQYMPMASTMGAHAGITGRVIATTNGGGYVFICVQSLRKTNWVATTRSNVKVGQDVILPKGEVMANFRSASLNRTFSEIWFVDHIQEFNHGEAALSSGAPAGTAGLPPGHPQVASPVSKVMKVGPITQPAGGISIAQIFEQRQKLAGREITIKGQVTRFTAGILGRNWVHISDGTGADGSNDLTITTNDRVAIGDIVTMRGTLVIDQDFGAGYKYSALLEKAVVQK